MKTKIAFEDLHIPMANTYKITSRVAELVSNYNNQYSKNTAKAPAESNIVNISCLNTEETLRVKLA